MSVRPFHHQRPLAALAAAYGAGVWAGVRFPWHPWLGVGGLTLSLTLIPLLHRAGRRRIEGFLAVALFLGLLLAGHAAHPSLPEAGKYQVTGIVAQDMTVREDGKAAGYLERVTLRGDEGEYRLSRIYWTYLPEEGVLFLPREGERVTFGGKLYHPQGQVNPYGFDFRLFLLQRGALAGISGAADAQTVDHPGRGLASLFYGARRALTQRVRLIFGADSALPEALLLGVREQLPDETVRGFSDAGVAHILSVSGLHVALLAGALMLPLRSLLSPGKRLGVLSVFLGCYCALLDFAVPVVRASMLLALGEFRRVVRRAHDPLTTLSAAFLLILLFRPLDLFSASFQLSFGAVLGMVLLTPVLARPFSWVRPRWLREGVCVTVAATAGTALPTIQVFHRFSLIGLAINPLVCAIMGLLLPVYAVVLLIGCVWLPAGQALALPVHFATRTLTAGIEALGKLPFAALRVPSLPWYVLGALVLCGMLATRFVLLPPRRKAGLAAVALLLSLGGWELTQCRDVQYLQMAMGQADAALILDDRETTLIDVGEYGGDVASYLLATGRRADRVILTHLHSDHCLGLRKLVEEEIPIGAIYLPLGGDEQQIDSTCLSLLDELKAQGVPVHYLSAGDELTGRRVKITVTWPQADTLRTGADPNRYGLVLLCQLNGVRLLSTGDLTGAYEGYAATEADILKVAHHGSKNSTSDAFLLRVSPRLALITSGGGGALLPSVETLDRLAQRAIPAYNTAEWGALTVTVHDGEITLSPYLRKGGGYEAQ